GIQEATDENGDPIGTLHGETRGHVHYVPDVGPVAMLEEFIPYVWIDCGVNPCPTEWQDLLGVTVQTQTLTLSRLPLGSATLSWGGVKTLYR
ncbi:MAG: hypothetical protein ABIF77_01795, partial [bacterium]